VPASTPNNALNLALDSVPPGDDYFLIFLNSSHQTTYTVSQRFTILASGGTPASAGPTNGAAQTMSVSGGPNPTVGFATTFAALANGAGAWAGARMHALAAAGVAAGVAVGGLAAVW
jgi:hypothetical protein